MFRRTLLCTNIQADDSYRGLLRHTLCAGAAKPIPVPCGFGMAAAATAAKADRQEFASALLSVCVARLLLNDWCCLSQIEYVIVFAASFNSWLGEAFYNTRFDTDDIISRFRTAFVLHRALFYLPCVTAAVVADLPQFWPWWQWWVRATA